MIRALTADEVASSPFRHLLWLAVEVGDRELDAIIRTELPRLTLQGIVENQRVVAFVAFDANSDPTEIEYIAVDERARGRGLGRMLVETTRDHSASRAVYAQSDDDAVDFYRRLGFDVTERAADPRWPERRRYDCVLAL